MIKKYLCLVILFILSGCGVERITEVIFIASIGLEIDDGEYVGFFYLPSSDDIGKTNEGNISGKGEFMKIKGKSVGEVFQKSQSYNELEVNLRHISSLVLNKDLLEEEFLFEFITFVKNTDYLDFNFYIFITSDKMENVYSFQNPNKESVLNSLLVSTYDSPYLYLASDSIHFLEFVRNIYLKKSIALPFLVVEEIWNIENVYAKSYSVDNVVYYYQNNCTVVYDDSLFFKDNERFYVDFGEDEVYILDYKINYKYRDKLFISIKCKYAPITSSKLDFKLELKRRINAYLLKYSNCDFLNLNYYNSIFNKNIKYNDIVVDISVV